ncbi:transfer protein spdA [Streptomyces sp. G2]|nr:transfer protein spdA [Streptomyces sp. G2]MCM1945464.1 transfer protein spdA [Streptomyces sp. G2]
MVISFATQRDLALSHGVPESVAPAVPIAVDLFMIWAVRTGRDVALSVAVAVAANVSGVLTAESLSAVGTWVSAGLHAVFPLTVWRMHRTESRERPSESLSALPADTESGNTLPGPQTATESQPGSWPDADLWADFEDSEPDAPATPPTADDVRAAIAVLESKHGRPVTGQLVAAHYGVSERTGRRYLAMAS